MNTAWVEVATHIKATKCGRQSQWIACTQQVYHLNTRSKWMQCPISGASVHSLNAVSNAPPYACACSWLEPECLGARSSDTSHWHQHQPTFWSPHQSAVHCNAAKLGGSPPHFTISGASQLTSQHGHALFYWHVH